MNVIARLEYELAYYDSAIHRFNHYTTRTPPSSTDRSVSFYQNSSVWLDILAYIYIYIYIYFHFCWNVCMYLLTPLHHGQDAKRSQFSKWSKVGLNSDFSFSLASCSAKIEESSLFYYQLAQSAGACRIHRLHHCRVSYLWHSTIWWWGFSNARVLGNAENSFIAIALRSTQARSGSTW